MKHAAVAAMEFALMSCDTDDEGMTFLRNWFHGDFDVIRKEWPEAPEEVFAGAAPSVTTIPDEDVFTYEPADESDPEAGFDIYRKGTPYCVGTALNEEVAQQMCGQTPEQPLLKVPEGYALVPEKMTLDREAMENILAMTGEDFSEDGFPECILFVGETYNADASDSPRYGLNIACAECMEEGCNPILYFEKPDLAQGGVSDHPDDRAVDSFAAAMKAKLAKKRGEGYGGWDDPDRCSTGMLQNLLLEHVSKGDPVDVGNFAMMLWNRGEATLPK